MTLDNVVMVLTGREIKELAHLIADVMRADFSKKDEHRLTVPKLSKVIGVGIDRIRAAIRAGHYGYIHPGQRGVFYATATEARAFHFGGEGKKKKSAGSK